MRELIIADEEIKDISECIREYTKEIEANRDEIIKIMTALVDGENITGDFGQNLKEFISCFQTMLGELCVLGTDTENSLKNYIEEVDIKDGDLYSLEV